MWASCCGSAWASIWMRAHFTPEETFTADQIGLTYEQFKFYLVSTASVSIGTVYIETETDDLVAYSDGAMYSISISSGDQQIECGAGTFWKNLIWIYPEYYEFTEDETYYVRVQLGVSSSSCGSVSMDSYSTSRGTEQGIALGDILLRDN
jgi:hypothetical protein